MFWPCSCPARHSGVTQSGPCDLYTTLCALVPYRYHVLGNRQSHAASDFVPAWSSFLCFTQPNSNSCMMQSVLDLEHGGLTIHSELGATN